MLKTIMVLIAAGTTAWWIMVVEDSQPAMKKCQETHSYDVCFNSIYR